MIISENRQPHEGMQYVFVVYIMHVRDDCQQNTDILLSIGFYQAFFQQGSLVH